MIGNKFSSILKNKKFFEGLLEKINSNRFSFNEKLDIALFALTFATLRPTGYFYSNVLEKFFIDIGKSKEIESYNINYQKGTVLHVMSKAYKSGGHTRCVERWINNQKGMKHSIVLILQGKEQVPETLRNNCEKSGGKLFFLNENDCIKNALILRKLALNYEYIVLHTHMDDPTATIAFGTEKFTRPILFFNHADHLFWIGKYISDLVVDFRTKTSITEKYRLINNHVKLSIPIDITNNANFFINRTSDTIFLSGSDFKFTPIGNQNIIPILDKILSLDQSLELCITGIKKHNQMWKKLNRKHIKRVHLFENMSYEKYLLKLRKAFVVVDSYPFPGGTALVDAVCNKIPFLSLKTTCGQTDFVENSQGMCQTSNELIEKILKIRKNKYYAQELLSNENKKLNEDTNIRIWNENLKHILKSLPNKHRLQEFTEQNVFINDYSFMNLILYRKQGKNIYKSFGIPYFFTFEKYKNIYGKTRKIKLFNFTILKWKRCVN